MKAQRIEGAVALVTGANRGIGRALTEALLTRGVKKVYATARNPEALRALRDERLVSLRLDVTDVNQIRAAEKLQRLEGRAPLADPGRAYPPQSSGHLGLRRLRGPH